MIPLHPKDREYFDQYPSPIMEKLQELHFTNINSTITFSPLLYFLARFIGAEQVLELGTAEGYSSFYLASAVKDNGIRYSMKNNMFYGIDIAQTNKTRKNLTDKGLPNTILELDTINLTPKTFEGITFDLIFQDGCHKTEHVLHELNVLYPQLKGEGKGYWLAHDIDGPCEEAYRIIYQQIKDGKYNFQYVGLGEIYGLGIFRKMDNYDYNKKRWTN